mmetsp:Transcript_1783/g.1888  ORF Transcript_1783/g.1888 Transcript_1783/m.1888 type:complete len:345 (-) Transcript_1783:324-1358(-)
MTARTTATNTPSNEGFLTETQTQTPLTNPTHSALHRNSTYLTKPPPPQPNHISLLCGLAAGISQAGLFNPYDRALYLSVRNRTPFLSFSNWKRPYAGFTQSIMGRAVQGGLFFPLEQWFTSRLLEARLDDVTFTSGSTPTASPLAHFLAGTGAGCTNALILNPLSAIKYKTWGRKRNRGMLNEISTMWVKGGARPFLNGMLPTILRDVSFGGTYTFLRWHLIGAYYGYIQTMNEATNIPAEHQWMANLVAASVATVVSSPFNLARNVQYSIKSETARPSIRKVLLKLRREMHTSTSENRPRPVWEQFRYAGMRLRIGWGTARVAIGISFGHFVYDYLNDLALNN